MTRDDIDNLLYIASVVQLDGLDFARTFTVDEIAASFNGIGADWMSDKLRGKLTDRLGLFAPAAMIHDLRYTKSDGKRYGFNFANIEFHNNCLKLARWAYPIWRFLRRFLAENAALALYKAVCSEGGWKAWTDAAEKNAARNCAPDTRNCAPDTRTGASDTRTGASDTRTGASDTRTGASTLNDSNRPYKGETMHKLITIAALAALFAGCKHITVETADWSASYFAVGQENDVKGMKIRAGENVALEVEQVKSNVDPAVAKAMEAAASALALAARACAAYASDGTSEAAAAVSSAVSSACADGSCSD